MEERIQNEKSCFYGMTADEILDYLMKHAFADECIRNFLDVSALILSVENSVEGSIQIIRNDIAAYNALIKDFSDESVRVALDRLKNHQKEYNVPFHKKEVEDAVLLYNICIRFFERLDEEVRRGSNINIELRNVMNDLFSVLKTFDQVVKVYYRESGYNGVLVISGFEYIVDSVLGGYLVNGLLSFKDYIECLKDIFIKDVGKVKF